MITTVTLNPAIDRTITVDTFVYGSVNRVGSSREDMGGKGINVARILGALGTECRATGFIGRRNLAQVESLLARDAIRCDLVPVEGTTRLNTKLLESSSRTTTDLNEAGFRVGETELAALKDKIAALAAESTFTVFSGSVPPGLPDTIYRDLVRLAGPACHTVLDADGELLRNGLEASPYLIKPNIHELENALGRRLPEAADIVAAAREIITRHGVTYVLVSMGGDGSILVSANAALKAEPIKVDVRGTVGAGDSLLAGFLHSLARGLAEADALACATACGALAVSREGTEAFTLEEVTACASHAVVHSL